MSNVASSLVAWRVFILRIIHREVYVIARRAFVPTKQSPFKRMILLKRRFLSRHKAAPRNDMRFEYDLRYNSSSQSGRSAVRLARLLWEQEVPGSNPGAPTNVLYIHYSQSKPATILCGGNRNCRKAFERTQCRKVKINAGWYPLGIDSHGKLYSTI